MELNRINLIRCLFTIFYYQVKINRKRIKNRKWGHYVFCIVLGCLLIYFIRYYSCFSVVVDLLTQLLILDFRVYYTPIVSRAHKFAVLLLIIVRAHIASWAFKSHAQSKYCIRTIIDRSSIYSLKRRGWPSSVMVSL